MMSPPLVALGAVLFLALTAISLRRLRLDWATVAIIVAGQGLYLAYLSYTDYNERNYDGDAQLAYITYIVEHRSLPPPSHCNICYHPPLYYVLAAGVYSLFEITRVAPPIAGLQLFSLALSLVFIVFGVLTARRIDADRGRIRLATALIVLWPYSIHNCVRVHNDTLVSTLTAIGLYLIVRWCQEPRPRYLYLAALVSTLAALTKSSGYALGAALGLVVAARFFSSRDKLRFLGRAGVALALLAAAPLWTHFGREKEKEPARTSRLCEGLLGSLPCKASSSNLLENGPYNYLYLDVPGFLKEPYAFAHRDAGGRQLFWNHLLKSSLFGTHNTTADPETAYELNRRAAGIMNALLLGMTGYLLAAGALVRARAVRRYGVMLLAVVALLGSAIGFRMLAPLAHHQDFRHIFAALIPMAVLYSAAVGYFRRTRPALERAGYALAIPFLALSVFYFLPKYDLIMRWPRVVPAKLSAYNHVAADGTPWDRKINLLMDGNHIVELAVPGGKTVAEIDISLDSNDSYELTLFGGGETRTLVLGPSPQGRPGLARYVERLDPPVSGVQRIRLRPLRGDKAYSMGHIVIR